MSSLGAASSFVTSSVFCTSSFLDSSTLGVAASGLASSLTSLLSTTGVTTLSWLSSVLADTTATSEPFPLTAVSEADTAPFPRNIKPAAIATDAAPKLYLRIP